MRLTDFLRDLGSPVVYYAPLTDITGSVTATLLLCQLVYWTGKQQDPDGWIYKTAADWWEELRLSRHELDGARDKLKKAGLIEEVRRGLPSRVYYRVVLEAVNSAWEASRECTLPKTGNVSDPIAAKHGDKNRQDSETTAQNTKEPHLMTLQERLAWDEARRKEKQPRRLPY